MMEFSTQYNFDRLQTLHRVSGKSYSTFGLQHGCLKFRNFAAPSPRCRLSVNERSSVCETGESLIVRRVPSVLFQSCQNICILGERSHARDSCWCIHFVFAAIWLGLCAIGCICLF